MHIMERNFKKMNRSFLFYIFVILIIIPIMLQPIYGQCDFPNYVESENWDDVSLWQLIPDHDCTIELLPYSGCNEDGIEIQYSLKPYSGWVIMRKDSISGYCENKPIVMLIKANAYSDMELKFVDEDGTVFGNRYSIENRYDDWTSIVIYLDDTNYWWGGDSIFHNLKYFEIAFTGGGSGNVWIDEVGIGKQGLLPGLFLDPYRILEGIGFKQRRHEYMIQEDSLVLAYLKVIQDSSSTDAKLPPSMEDDYVSTFNSALVAMAFLIKCERERAERILDFYADATDSNNQDLLLQNFFYNGEARGFYQNMSLSTYHAGESTDRWIGDMAWLLIAYKFYEQKYNSEKYSTIRDLIKNLFISFYKEENNGGYIQHGWRKGDSYLHENHGHPEGNISCYAAFKLCEEDTYAQNIRIWLDSVLVGNDLPLDNYSWRVIAHGKGYEYLLNRPECDLRYRKKLEVNGTEVLGFYPYPNIDINNIWIDGIGHIACAYLVYGEKERGYFYANQFDPLLFDRTIYSKNTKTLSYAVNKFGEFGWIDTTKGAISSDAWYIFAKNGFNPMSLTFTDINTRIQKLEKITVKEFKLNANYPNPFNQTTKISYSLPNSAHVTIKIYNILGQQIFTLVNEQKSPGNFYVLWNGENESGNDMPSGLYFYRVQAGGFIKSCKMTLIR